MKILLLAPFTSRIQMDIRMEFSFFQPSCRIDGKIPNFAKLMIFRGFNCRFLLIFNQIE